MSIWSAVTEPAVARHTRVVLVWRGRGRCAASPTEFQADRGEAVGACERGKTSSPDEETAGQSTCRGKPAGGDGEPADRRDSVDRVAPAGWPSICAAYLGTLAGSAVPRLALLRVGFAEPPGSPRALVRSYRTVSPLPVRLAAPSAVCSLWHFPAGRPDWPLASTLPCGVPTFLDAVPASGSTPRPPGRLTVSTSIAPDAQTSYGADWGTLLA